MFNNKKLYKYAVYYSIAGIILILIINYLKVSINTESITYNRFLDLLEQKKVAEVQVTQDRVTLIPKQNSGINKKILYTGRIYDPDLKNELKASGAQITAPSGGDDPIKNFLFTWILPLIPIIIIGKFLFGRLDKKFGGGVMSFGKNNAKLYAENETGKSFEDVAGQDEAKESLVEIVDFLHNSEKYSEIGAKLPKGALLVGPPGTGKTLLAKAVAGEAKVPFFSMSGSNFVEMFVGMGAARVRDLFEQAQEKAPCIVFIDEIDAIGKSRDGGVGGGNDEREQTLNQLLAEMDGFDSSKGVVILAATNRPEVLDKALLRPGRFDRRVIVDRPDIKGREAILKVHSKAVKISENVNLSDIAKATPGAVGADLANIVNEAALLAVKSGRKEVIQDDLEEAVEVIIAGKEKKDRILSETEKRTVAFHEVGHALIAALLKHTDPVHKITIVPRTMGALGYTMQLPEEEKYLVSREQMLDEIAVMLGGRSAEEVEFSIISTGASNDIERATQMARNMVTIYGMTDRFDMMALESVQNRYLDGRPVQNCSAETSTVIDNEVLNIIKEAHNKAKDILNKNRQLLEQVADILIEKETLMGEEFMEIVKGIQRGWKKDLTAEQIAEFDKEQKKLESVIRTISNEILHYIKTRKDIAEYIIENRKKSLEEFEDDEDKVIEYFDHERFVKERAFSTIDRRLKEFTILELSPYFGRIDFKEERYGEEEIYIGRFGITPTGQEQALVIDWRAPVSSLFYENGLGKATYKAPMGDIEVEVLKKRQYVIKRKKLLGLFDTAIDVKDDILQLMLSKNSEAKLTDIVMTIQKEQNNIIRQPRNNVVVVNGTAGSGKTTIALHRVAYLLYNYREILQDKVLILGPNKIFMEYIASVLPSLGEVGVNQQTYTNFAIEVLDFNKRDVMTSKQYMERILNGDEEFNKSIIYKNSDQFIERLDKLVEDASKKYYKVQNVVYNGKIITNQDEIYELFESYYVQMPLFRRAKKVKRIIFAKLRDERNNIVRQINKEYKEKVENLSNEERNLQQNAIEFDRKLKVREAIRELMKVKKELMWLDNPNIKEVYSEVLPDEKLYTVDDLTALLYLSIKLDGLKLDTEVKHVVVDEAQDYSKLAFIVIKELTKCSGMTIVGDTNQRLIPIEGQLAIENMQSVVQDIEIEYFKLNKSYRSTVEIMEYANKFLKQESVVPIVRNGKPVDEFKISDKTEVINKVLEIINDYKEDEHESVAIICKDLNHTNEIGKCLKGYAGIIDREDAIYNGGVVVIPSYLAKGLEFDGVIIIQDDDTKEDKAKYVMATRALHRLSVIYTPNVEVF